jgi:uncharacterized protein YdaT
MPQMDHYSRTLKNTAMDVADTLLDEGQRLTEAAAAALARARTWSRREDRLDSDGCDRGTLHLIPYGDNWAVRREGDRRCSEIYGSRDGALERGRELARRESGVLVVHRPSGEVEGQIDYSDDVAA